ncbi:MAG TPA: GGDEF domain-containing protein [Burkholderiaceae bacterium]|nr:GGDEF domain-containing protein [Burkholderiaceae bacterium]
MSLNTNQVLALGNPAIIVIFSMIFVGVWAVSGRSRHYLLLFAATFCLFAAGVTCRIIRLPASTEANAMTTAALYLASAILMVKGAATRYRIRLNTTLLVMLAITLLVIIGYFVEVRHDLILRMYILNLGVAALLFVPIKPWWGLSGQRPVDWMLFWVYTAFTFSFIPRMLLYTTSISQTSQRTFTQSPIWVALELVALISIMVLGLAVLAAAVVDLVDDLQKERNLDGLTQLHNRRSFEEHCLILVTERRHRPISMMMCDIDYFKSINDRYGHNAGDIVLQEFGRILLECVRFDDFAARVGGEEFAVLLPDTTLEGATQFADRVRTRLSQTPFTVKPLTDTAHVTQLVTASFGVVQREKNEPLTDLLLRADATLYAAKSNGRNNVTIAGELRVRQSHHHCH